jgi:MtN3 and saliva related transmembrane protein
MSHIPSIPEMIVIRSIGFIGGVCTTLSFSPQVVHLWKASYSHQVDGLSLGMYGIYTVGTWLWIIYGILMKDIMIVMFNILSSILVLYCLYKIVSIRYPRTKNQRQHLEEYNSRDDSKKESEEG